MTEGHELFPAHMVFAVQELGTTEIAGAADNPRIVEYHKTTTLRADDDETPWCSSFANWCMIQGGYKGTGLALARSWAVWGQDVGIKYDRNSWKFGDVCVLTRDGAGPNAGHVGFLVKWNDAFVWLLGGNQGNAVSIARFPRERVIALRRPE